MMVFETYVALTEGVGHGETRLFAVEVPIAANNSSTSALNALSFWSRPKIRVAKSQRLEPDGTTMAAKSARSFPSHWYDNRTTTVIRKAPPTRHVVAVKASIASKTMVVVTTMAGITKTGHINNTENAKRSAWAFAIVYAIALRRAAFK